MTCTYNTYYYLGIVVPSLWCLVDEEENVWLPYPLDAELNMLPYPLDAELNLLPYSLDAELKWLPYPLDAELKWLPYPLNVVLKGIQNVDIIILH